MQRDEKYRGLKVLYVDDEEQSLKYFKMALSKVADVLTARDADQALQILDQHAHEIGALISDQKMPGRSGVELLGEVRYQHPEIVRVLTTAYAELDDAIDAVNSGAIFAYVTKPWQLKDLQTTILQALELSVVQRERDLLLKEKLSVLQRQLLVDRLRSASILAAALAGQLRNTTTAAYEFMHHQRDSSGASTARDSDDMWDCMRTEAAQTARIARQLAQVLCDSERSPDEIGEVDSEACWYRAAEAAGVPLRVEAPRDLPRVKTSETLLEAACRFVLSALSPSPERETLPRVVTGSLTNDIWGSSGVRWSLGVAPGAETRALFDAFAMRSSRHSAPALMSAYFLLYHLGGRVQIAERGELSVELPLDSSSIRISEPDEDWVELMFEELPNPLHPE